MKTYSALLFLVVVTSATALATAPDMSPSATRLRKKTCDDQCLGRQTGLVEACKQRAGAKLNQCMELVSKAQDACQNSCKTEETARDQQYRRGHPASGNQK